MRKDTLIQLDGMVIPGLRLARPQPEAVYSVLFFRDDDQEELVIEVQEGSSAASPVDLPEPVTIATLRVPRGALTRALDVLTALTAQFEPRAEMRQRLSNLHTAMPDPERDDG